MYINIKKYCVTLIIFIFSFATFALLSDNYEKVIAKDLSKSVIRFHVRANSDSAEDQQLKMKVKEAVVNYLNDNMTDVTDTKDAGHYLEASKTTITGIANKIIRDNGYDYTATSFLGKSSFPDKSYGDVRFPAGEYNSFIINIGSGKGHNWWCVLYPPLCFVDASTGILPESSKNTLKDSISSSEYDYVSDETASEEEDVNIRFKYLSFLNDIFD